MPRKGDPPASCLRNAEQHPAAGPAVPLPTSAEPACPERSSPGPSRPGGSPSPPPFLFPCPVSLAFGRNSWERQAGRGLCLPQQGCRSGAGAARARILQQPCSAALYGKGSGSDRLERCLKCAVTPSTVLLLPPSLLFPGLLQLVLLWGRDRLVPHFSTTGTVSQSLSTAAATRAPAVDD